MKPLHSISFLLFVLGTVAVQLQFPEGDNIVANAPTTLDEDLIYPELILTPPS
jgi:hypothetical protein